MHSKMLLAQFIISHKKAYTNLVQLDWSEVQQELWGYFLCIDF